MLTAAICTYILTQTPLATVLLKATGRSYRIRVPLGMSANQTERQDTDPAVLMLDQPFLVDTPMSIVATTQPKMNQTMLRVAQAASGEKDLVAGPPIRGHYGLTARVLMTKGPVEKPQSRIAVFEGPKDYLVIVMSAKDGKSMPECVSTFEITVKSVREMRQR